MTRPYYESLIEDWKKKKGVWATHPFSFAALTSQFWQSELTDTWRNRDKTDRVLRRTDGALFLLEQMMDDAGTELEWQLLRLRRKSSRWRRFKVWCWSLLVKLGL